VVFPRAARLDDVEFHSSSHLAGLSIPSESSGHSGEGEVESAPGARGTLPRFRAHTKSGGSSGDTIKDFSVVCQPESIGFGTIALTGEIRALAEDATNSRF
jgi:hypothetical protein